MSDSRSQSKRSKPAAPKGEEAADRMPTNAELLHELRKHGAPPPPPRALPVVSRRTRDYLILATVGSAIIGFASFRLVGADPTAALRLALTGVGVFCGLLWFVFYGVMSRY